MNGKWGETALDWMSTLYALKTKYFNILDCSYLNIVLHNSSGDDFRSKVIWCRVSPP